MSQAYKKVEQFQIGGFIKYPLGKSVFTGRILSKISDNKYLIEYCISSKDLDNPIFDVAEVYATEIQSIYR